VNGVRRLTMRSGASPHDQHAASDAEPGTGFPILGNHDSAPFFTGTCSRYSTTRDTSAGDDFAVKNGEQWHHRVRAFSVVDKRLNCRQCGC